jgi:hypothetical protein
MGWCSASDIFDTVAQGLINADASREVMFETLTPLVERLRADDWDCEHSSLARFRDNTVIVDLFAVFGVTE